MINVSKMAMTKSQAILAIDKGTNNQTIMTSIAETAMEHAPADGKTTEKETNLGLDGKRRRSTTSGIAEAPNRRPPKLLKPDKNSTEEDDDDLPPVTQAGNT
jgi:glutamate dehydrogenase/leucine dehydrogenase